MLCKRLPEAKSHLCHDRHDRNFQGESFEAFEKEKKLWRPNVSRARPYGNAAGGAPVVPPGHWEPPRLEDNPLLAAAATYRPGHWLGLNSTIEKPLGSKWRRIL